MQAHYAESITGSHLALAVKQAQAAAQIERLPATLAVNLGVSVSAMLMSGINRGLGAAAIVWLAVTVLTIGARFTIRQFMQMRRTAYSNPVLALRIMTVGALMTGLAWAALPLALPDFEPLGLDAGIYILMCGMATGAVLLGTGHSVTGLAFALPIHLSVVVALVMTKEADGHLLALSVLALTLVLYKSSMKGENIVIGSVEAQLRATALAQSLCKANSEILQANERLEILANSDTLTGVANRGAFNAALAKSIAQAERNRERLALLVLDLDRFKTINDTFGHAAGDELLLEASRRLRRSAGDGALIARLGGDEFAIILDGPTADDDARRLATTILEQTRTPFMLEGRPVISGGSVGVAVWPDHAATATDLFVSADMALYRAKDDGRGLWREFDRSMKEQAERRHRIEQDLATAIRAGDVRPVFQPQVDVTGKRVVGFETLARWQHPELGAIAPPEIVAAAHATRLCEALTTTIADGACRLLRDLPALGLPEATVSVNISPSEFELYSVAEALDRVTRAHGVDPALFEIEITEEAILDTLVAGEQLQHIEQSGYKLAVDDFGAGHSSLAYLVSLKVDRLKLDRRFVSGIEKSRQNQEIVGALVRLGRVLSMDIVSEGVETAEEAATLQTLGCPTLQGYLLGRPMPAEAIPEWLTANRKNTSAAA
jgi:diguanylate cyclase (GGDEF)-like protein